MSHEHQGFLAWLVPLVAGTAGIFVPCARHQNWWQKLIFRHLMALSALEYQVVVVLEEGTRAA